MLPTKTSTPATLKQYNKDQPPGWRPRAYPLREYKENLLIWSRLTRLTEQQAGAAVMSRLEGNALKRAKTLKVTRLNLDTLVEETFEGVEAVLLARRPGGVTAQGIQYPACRSGIEELLDQLFEAYHLDDQDLAWTSIDRFFSFKQTHDMDFQEYLHEWESHYDEAERYGGLQLSEPTKCWLIWSRTSFADRIIADLRLRVNGDLNRWRDMVSLQLKIAKNEFASREQAKDYRGTYQTDTSRVISGDTATHNDEVLRLRLARPNLVRRRPRRLGLRGLRRGLLGGLRQLRH